MGKGIYIDGYWRIGIVFNSIIISTDGRDTDTDGYSITILTPITTGIIGILHGILQGVTAAAGTLWLSGSIMI